MRIAIIDDEKPARSELKYLLAENRENLEIQEVSSGEEALKLLSKEEFDLLFIDINLGDISGTTIAKTARKINPQVEIVFATAYNNCAEDAFEVEALDYLLKPFSSKKIEIMWEKYDKKLKGFHSSKEIIEKIPLNVDKKIVLVDVSSIVYIEAQNKNCIIHTLKGDYVDNTPLKEFAEKLKDVGFFRIHKSYVVNTKYIIELHPWFNNSWCVKMKNFEEEILTVSRNKFGELKDILQI